MAQTAVAETKIQFEQAKRDLKRTSDLFTNKISTQSELDKAQSDADAFHARLERQQAEIIVAERDVATWDQQLDDTSFARRFRV